MSSTMGYLYETPAPATYKRKFSPVRVLIFLVIMIFLAEMVAMLVIYYLPTPNYLVTTLLDGFIMMGLILPALYFLQLKPLMSQIVERQQAEQALRTSETHLKRVMEAMPVGVWIIDHNGNVVHGNPASQEIWAGARYVGLQEYTEYKAWWPDTGERLTSSDWAATRAVRSGETTLNEEVNIEAFDGAHKTILNSAVPILDEQNTIQGAVVINQDITSLKQIQQSLEQSESLFRTAMENLPVGVWLSDGTGKIIYGNPAGQAIWAGVRYVDKEEYGEYKGWWLSTGELIQPQDWAVDRAVHRGETSLNEEIEIECFDGSHKYILNSAIPVFDDRGKTLWVFVVNQDITERKQRERELVRTNALLEKFINSIHILVAYLDRDFNFIRANEAYASAAGHPTDYFMGKNHFDLYPHEENQAIFQQVVDTGEPFIVYEKPFEYPEYPERGVTYWDWSLMPVKGADGAVEGLVFSLLDVTEHKRNEILLEKQNQELLALSEAEREQRDFAESLVQATITLSSSLQLMEVLDAILEQIHRAIPFQMADIALLEGRTIRVVGFRSANGDPGITEAMGKLYSLDDFPLWIEAHSSRRPELVVDSLQTEGWQIVPGMEWVRSFATAPLIADGQVIGFINLSSEQPYFFDHDKVTQLQAFAVPAALAIQNARLYEMESNARHVAETLSTTALALTRTLDLDQVIHTLLDHIQGVVSSDVAGVSLLEDESHMALQAVRGYDLQDDTGVLPSFPVDGITDSVIRRMIAAQMSMIVPKMEPDPLLESASGLDAGCNWLLVPIIASDKVIGMVQLGRCGDERFTSDQVKFAEVLVSQAAVAIQNAWLFQQVSSSSERLQTLTRTLVEIQEKERAHVARELHDEAGQALSLLKLSLGRLQQDPDCPGQVRQRLEDLKGVTDSVLEELHRLAVDLRPIALDHLGLVAALKQYAKELSSDGLTIQFKALGFDEGRLPKDLETSLYRIVQEALANVVRHSRSSNVGILIERSASGVKLFIEDDGIGFDHSLPVNNHSMGLVGMRERAEMFGGVLTIESSPGKGTSIIVEVPDVDSHLDR